MTVRSVLLGFVGAILICSLTYFNDAIMKQTFFIGNLLPISVFGSLVILLIVINPLLSLLSKKLVLSGREIAVILIMALAVCAIPGSGLLRTFTDTLMLPNRNKNTDSNLVASHVVDKVPKIMLAHVTPNTENEALNGFIQGLGKGNKNIAISQVPWYAWKDTLAFWIPLIITLWIGLLGLGLVVHRQWADHEQLPYPIANFANSLLPQGKQLLSDLFHNRLFWTGLLVIMGIHLNNYAQQWYPGMIPIPVTLDFSSLEKAFPLYISGGGWWTFHPNIYFTVIAFSFFLASDVSLSLGIGTSFCYLITGVLTAYGISTTYKMLDMNTFWTFGAYVGMFLVLIYTGRRYYLAVCKRAMFLPSAERPHAESVWGARIFLVAALVFIGYLTFLGKLEWPFAVLFTLIIVMIFTVMSRIVAETGLFMVQPNFRPETILIGFLGWYALGPQAALLLALISTVFLIDPREAFMPFAINSLRLMDLQKLKVARMVIVFVFALLLGFAVAVPVTLYHQYNHGTNMWDSWATSVAPNMPFWSYDGLKQQLDGQDRFAQSAALSGLGHFTHMTPNPLMMLAALLGLVAVLLFTVARLRFTKWPLHPVMFLIWNFYAGWIFAPSFFLGWLIKVLVTKFGGGALYRQLKPLMIGVIAGEMVGGLIIMAIGWIYFIVSHGQQPKPFGIMPG